MKILQHWDSINNQTSIASTRIYLRKIREKENDLSALIAYQISFRHFCVQWQSVLFVISKAFLGWVQIDCFYPSVYCYAFRLR